MTDGELHRIGTAALLKALGGRRKRPMLRALFELRLGQTCCKDMQIEYLWGGRADGGPLYVRNICSIYILGLRRGGSRITRQTGNTYRIERVA